MYSIKMLKAVLLALFITIITGCIVFARLEHLDYFTSLWMTIETVFTVGYGDYYPHTQAGRMFALLIIPLGFGLITYFIGTIVSLVVEGNINVNFRRKRMHKMIASMKDHIIVCGYGRVGQQVVKLLMNDDNKIVIIENNAAMLESVPAGIPYMVSDATEDIVLLDAGLKKQKVLLYACRRMRIHFLQHSLQEE